MGQTRQTGGRAELVGEARTHGSRRSDYLRVVRTGCKSGKGSRSDRPTSQAGRYWQWRRDGVGEVDLARDGV